MNVQEVNKELLQFLDHSPNAFYAVANMQKELEDAGFARLYEGCPWMLSEGHGYYVTRNDSAIIAFRIPEGEYTGFQIMASHCDSPVFIFDTEKFRAEVDPLQSSAEARSPGMKYKHYAPNASIVIVRGTPEQIAARYDASVAAGKKTAILCADRAPYGDRFAYELGHDASEMASRLFAALRAMDDDGIEAAFSEQTPTDGVGLALTNRLLRAAGFQVEEG